jgi:uncharacterized integral membrane protein
VHERRAEQAEGRSGPSPTLIVLIVLAAVAVVFVLQNKDPQSVDFLFLDVKAPEWVIFAILLAVGALLDRLLQFWMRRRRGRPLPPPAPE